MKITGTLTLCILLLLFSSRYLFSQTVIQGTVKSSITRAGIESVVVKILDNGRIEAFGISKKDGSYEIKTNSKEPKLLLSFEHLSYNKLEKSISNYSQTVDVLLDEKQMELREVTVYAPKIIQRGDTLTYRLAAFIGKGDISLEDAMKNLPGITVSSGGSIQYLGKDISTFYIDGLDMLGGRYNLATRGLPVTAVSSVEILENHQDIKQLQKRVYSDNVAINIKLSPKAKLKPFGTSEVSAGYGEEGLLYRLGLTGMLFTPKFQTISSVKLGNVGALASQELTNHFDDEKELLSKAYTVLGDMNASTPPLKDNRYRSMKDGMVSVNTINKLSGDATLKANADYSYNQNDYGYNTVSNYYVGNENVMVSENISPQKKVHMPAFAIEYKLNDSALYIRNRLSVRGRFEEDEYNVYRNAHKIGQNRDAIVVDLSNLFDVRKRIGEHFWNVSSLLKYTTTPENQIEFIGVENVDGKFFQKSQGNTFFTKEEMNFSFGVGKYSRIDLPVSLQLAHDDINTNLHKNQVDFSNRITGSQLQTSLAPQFELNAPNNRFIFRLTVPVRYFFLNYKHVNDKDPFRFSKPFLDPNIYLNYAVTSSLKFNLKAGLMYEVGDLLDFLTQPVQVSYRSQQVKSGILAQNKKEFANFKVEYKRPLDFLFVNAQVNYTNTKRNLLSSQFIKGDNVVASSVFADNHSKSVYSNLSITQQIQPIRTKLTVGGAYSWSKSEVMQQEIKTPYRGQVASFLGEVISRPWQWIELKYSTTINKTFSSFLDVRQSLLSQSHFTKLSVFPSSVLQLYTQVEFERSEVASSIYKSMALCDLGVRYKVRSLQFQLTLNNLFDSKRYAYTVFSGLDYFSYDYKLKRREFVFSVILFQ